MVPAVRGLVAEVRSDARSSVRRWVVVVLAGICALVGTVGAFARVQELGERAGANAARDWAEREIGGGNALGVDKEAVYAARALIPRDATYHLVVGDRAPGATELTAVGLPDFFRQFLLPRRPVQTGGDWVICYGCDPASVPGYEPLWDSGDGVSIGRATAS